MRTIAEILHSYEELDGDGRHIGGTDKEGPNHHYGDVYEWLFSCAYQNAEMEYPGVGNWGSKTVRNKIELILEVGVADGACLLAWSEIFPNARIVGMDIHPCVRANQCDRIEFHLGDQRVQHDCDRVAGGRQFDLIVDDGTHLLEDNLRTLLYLWKYVRPGGLYVIEEFYNVGSLRANILALWPQAEVIDTMGPSGGCEPLVVMSKGK